MWSAIDWSPQRPAMGNIRSVRDLDVYEAAMDAAMDIFELTKELPEEETYSMID